MQQLRINWKNVAGNLAGGVFGILAGIALIATSFQDYVQVVSFGMGLVFLSAGSFLVYGVIDFPAYTLSDKELIIRSLIRRVKIDLSTITEVISADPDDKTSMLMISVGTKTYVIESGETTDYVRIVDCLKHRIVQSKKVEKQFVKIIWAIVAVIGIPIVLMPLVLLFFAKSAPQKIDDLASLTIILIEDPTLTGRRNKTWNLTSVHDPAFTFQIRNDLVQSTIIRGLHKADTLTILIDAYDLKTKWLKTHKPTWVDKHLNWSSIRIYGITQSGEQLLDPEKLLSSNSWTDRK